MSRWVAMLTTVVVGVALSACSSSAQHGTGAAATRTSVASSPAGPVTTTKTYSPYAAAGTLVVPVAASQPSGACWTGSIAVPKPGVYRCLVGNSIDDPCWSGQADATVVVCAADPWDTATLVHLTAPLPQPAAPRTASHPWALELANGAHCITATGMVGAVGSVQLTYLCGASASAGGVQTTGLLTTVQYGPPDGPLSTVDVTVAWNA